MAFRTSLPKSVGGPERLACLNFPVLRQGPHEASYGYDRLIK